MNDFQNIIQSDSIVNIDKERQRINEGTANLIKELSIKWDQEFSDSQVFPNAISMIHPDAIEFLLNFNRMNDYREIANAANIIEIERNILGDIVWKIAQTKKWEKIKDELMLHFGDKKVEIIADLLEQKILSTVKEITLKPFLAGKQFINEDKKRLECSLTQAMIDFPKLGEQAVTSNLLKLRYFPELVKPSIKNWITDYHDNLGAGKHGTIDRGNYLFHSENGKRLTPIERQKVSLLLKSLDEDSVLDIDGDAQVVLFNVQKNQAAQTPAIVEKPSEKEIISNEKSKEADDVQLARIRQSLDFSKKPNIEVDEKKPVFSFEDTDYAKSLSEKIQLNSQSKIETLGFDQSDDSGKYVFTSPQKLPVEYGMRPSEKSVAPRIKVEESPFGIKSPDFKGHIADASSKKEDSGSVKIQGNVVDLS